MYGHFMTLDVCCEVDVQRGCTFSLLSHNMRKQLDVKLQTKLHLSAILNDISLFSDEVDFFHILYFFFYKVDS